ncbi:molybdenum cofactor guanylyltransferase MobA [Aquibium sp. A9E412]|uniref:molybdenum cofactor guanylyltransferase MobA n=1 Tax=Aquibium sp. A9E412 TaxID=2976767 RepID=UPI0025AF323B|nr:molybdenum cofactor guanylyltransferase MobA [Aquibium sp. A9E412]MDN2567663.1 molybdenum cofactor guanylyltransferase MobA [Aquibium sp. A9E412]
MSAIAGIILAGGRATRMGGGDKALLRLAGRPLVEHVQARLAPQVAALALNANGDPARFAATGLPVIADTLPGRPGPLAGVLAGMLWARTALPGATALATAPVDCPFLPGDLVARLAAAAAPGTIALARSAGRRHPVAALWPLALADDLAAFLAAGHARVGAFAGTRHPAVAVDFADGGIDPFFNVNTPADLATAGRHCAAAAR